MKVGFVGTGRMGQAMSRRLIEAGHDLAVYDRVPEQIGALVEAGAKAMGSLAQAARYGEAVFTMLPDDAALDAVVGAGGRIAGIAAAGRRACLLRHAWHRHHSQAQGRTFRARPDPPHRPHARPARAGGVRAGRHGDRGAAGRSSTLRAFVLGNCPAQLSRRGPIRKPRRQSRLPPTSCSAAPLKPWAKALRWCASMVSCLTYSTTC